VVLLAQFNTGDSYAVTKVSAAHPSLCESSSDRHACDSAGAAVLVLMLALRAGDERLCRRDLL
jgi:hypothetical protein